MKPTQLFIALCIAGLSGGVFAQSLQTIQQRNVNQQSRRIHQLKTNPEVRPS